MRFGRNPNSGANTDNTRLEDTLNEATRTQVGTEDEQEDVEVALESLSQWQLAWRRFRRHRLAMIGVVILTFMVLVAIFGPILQPLQPEYHAAQARPVVIRRYGQPTSLARPARTRTSSTWSSTAPASR